MRAISLFAFILVSTTLLSKSYHHAGAIGIDSASHGLVYDGRVVRRYGTLYRGLQERAEDPKGLGAKGPTKVPANNNKAPVPDNNNKSPVLDNNNKPPAPPAPENNNKFPAPPAPENNNKPPAPPAPENNNKSPAPPAPPAPPTISATPAIKPPVPAIKTPPTSPTPSTTPTPKNTVPKQAEDTTDTTTLSDQDADTTGGTPTVATGSLSGSAIGGLASVGGVFVLVGGLFAFSQRKKNKEMTKSIVSNSAKAWEQQQNSTYEVMEEETKSIGSFMVIATYTPTLSDELEIQPGDRVSILVEYDDGWVQGINETRGGIKGVFPRHCVDMSQSSNKTNKNNKRSSSMGGGYTEVDLS